MKKIMAMIFLLIYQGGLFSLLKHDGSEFDLIKLHLIGMTTIAQILIFALG